MPRVCVKVWVWVRALQNSPSKPPSNSISKPPRCLYSHKLNVQRSSWLDRSRVMRTFGDSPAVLKRSASPPNSPLTWDDRKFFSFFKNTCTHILALYVCVFYVCVSGFGLDRWCLVLWDGVESIHFGSLLFSSHRGRKTSETALRPSGDTKAPQWSKMKFIWVDCSCWKASGGRLWWRFYRLLSKIHPQKWFFWSDIWGEVRKRTKTYWMEGPPFYHFSGQQWQR